MTLDTDMGNYGRKTLDVMDRAEWYNKWLIDTACQYLKGEILEVGFGIGSFTIKSEDWKDIRFAMSTCLFCNMRKIPGSIEKSYRPFLLRLKSSTPGTALTSASNAPPG